MKYQPYHGYGSAQPWLWYGPQPCPRRVRTRGDWHYNLSSWWWTDSDGIYAFWHRPHDSNGARYEKQKVHRQFRRRAKRLIQRELAGEEVSHNIIVSGDYLD